MDRLEFLKKGALVAAGTVVGGAAISSLAGLTSCSSKPKEKVIGLQLYSLREAMGVDPATTLKLVSEMGYKTLETASYGDGKIYGYAPTEFRKIVEGLGMKVTSAHIGPNYTPEQDAVVMEWWSKAIDDHLAAGCSYVVKPSMHIGDTLDNVKMYCDYYNKVAEKAKVAGLQFGFHNHSGEFKDFDGVCMYDYMLENTSKDMIYEMDVYWVHKAGKSPVEYLNKYAGRFPVLHIKDESIIGASETIDFQPIFEAAYKQGMKDYFVEVERYTQPAENCVSHSFDFLNNSDFVK